MKRLWILIICMCLFSGCVNKKVNENDEELKIVTSFYPVYIFAQNVTDGIPDISVKNLTLKSATGCLHGYHLTTANMKDIEEADIFLINGAGMEESFLDDIKEAYPELLIVDTSDGIEVAKSVLSEEENSHIWLNVKNAKKQVTNIENALIGIDNKNSNLYIENTKKYLNKLDELNNYIEEYDYNIVAMHDSLYYFADGLNLKIIDVIQNDEEDVPSPKRLQEIAKKIKDNNVKAIFTETQFSDKLPNMLSDETGVSVYVFDSITGGNGDKNDYIDKMKANFELVKQMSEQI